MLVIPAIYILGGHCVRLVRGDYSHPTVYSDDPMDVAASFAGAGAERIHVVDLDAARGSGDNHKLIEAIVRRDDVKVQVAGGIRTEEHVDRLLAAGAQAVVMGTAAVRQPRLLERCVRKHTGRVLAALDVRGDQAAVSGWTESEPLRIGSLLARWDVLPLGGVILTSIDKDGTLEGPDLKTLKRVRETDYLEHIQALGTRLRAGLAERADAAGVALRQTGPVTMPLFLFEDDPDLRQGFFWSSEMLRRGVYVHPWHNMFLCAAMTEADMDLALEAADGAFAALKAKSPAALAPVEKMSFLLA